MSPLTDRELGPSSAEIAGLDIFHKLGWLPLCILNITELRPNIRPVKYIFSHRPAWLLMAAVCSKAGIVLLICPRREKTCLRGFANNTDADLPAHSRSLISASVIPILESNIFNIASGKISIF